MVGAPTYKLLRSLTAPKKPSEVQIPELMKLAASHFHPQPSLPLQHFRFNSQMRQAGESELTLKKAFEVAQAVESADTQVQELQHSRTTAVHDVGPQSRPSRVQELQGAPVDNRSPTHRELLFAHLSSLVSPTHVCALFTPSHRTALQRRAPSQPRTPCPICGQIHWASMCKFHQALCHNCGKHRHIRSMCHSTSSTVRPRQQDNKYASKTQQPNKVHIRHDTANNIFQCTGSSTPPICIKLTVNGAPLVMELDTGASVSIINENTYHNTRTAKKRPPLLPSDARLYTYLVELIKVLGTTSVTVRYKDQVRKLSLLVVPTDGPSFLGRDWLHAITLDWKQLNHVHQVRHRALKNVLDQYADLFKPEMGTLQGTTVKIHIKPDVHPQFSRARPVPYALRENVTSELERLRKADVIEPVQFSDWAAPIIPCSSRMAASGYVATTSRQ